MQQQQTIISDLNPNAAEFVSKEELWFITKEKEFVTNNTWLFEGGLGRSPGQAGDSDEDDDNKKDTPDTEWENEPCSTPPQMFEECEMEECEDRVFYDCN